MADVTNDNELGATPDIRFPDAHGQAALLLVESLIHALIDKSVIDTGDALDVVDVASDVMGEIVIDLDSLPGAVPPAHTLLAAIGKSLRNDQ